MKIILSRKFLKYFLISFSIFLGLLLLQLLGRYSDDIFNNGIPIGLILKLVFSAMLTLVGFSLLFGILIASIFSFRYFSNLNQLAFRKKLLSGLIIISSLSMIFLGFNNWILPKSNLEFRCLLYDMKSKMPGEEMERVDKNLFLDNQAVMIITSINLKLDTFNILINESKYDCDSILELLPDSIARETFDRLSFEDYGLTYKFSTLDSLSERQVQQTSRYLRAYHSKLRKNVTLKQKYLKEKISRIVIPFELILIYLLGASFGFCYNNQKPFLLVVLGLYTTSFFYSALNGFDRILSQNFMGLGKSIIFSFVVLAIITLIFVRKGIRKEKITQPNTR